MMTVPGQRLWTPRCCAEGHSARGRRLARRAITLVAPPLIFGAAVNYFWLFYYVHYPLRDSYCYFIGLVTTFFIRFMFSLLLLYFFF